MGLARTPPGNHRDAGTTCKPELGRFRLSDSVHHGYNLRLQIAHKNPRLRPLPSRQGPLEPQINDFVICSALTGAFSVTPNNSRECACCLSASPSTLDKGVLCLNLFPRKYLGTRTTCLEIVFEATENRSPARQESSIGGDWRKAIRTAASWPRKLHATLGLPGFAVLTKNEDLNF